MNQLLWGYKTKEMYDNEDTIIAAASRAKVPTDPVSQERIRQWRIKRGKFARIGKREGIT